MDWISLGLKHNAMAKRNVVRRITQITSISVLALGVLGCDQGGAGSFLETVIAPDSQLEQTSNPLDANGNLTVSACPEVILSQLPPVFPKALCYASASLLKAEVQKTPDDEDNGQEKPSAADSAELLPGDSLHTQWETTQPIATVQAFYQAFFDQDEWQITRQPHELDNAGIFQAVKGRDRITIRFRNFAPQPSAGERDLISISKVQPLAYTLTYRKSPTFEWSASAGVPQDQGQSDNVSGRTEQNTDDESPKTAPSENRTSDAVDRENASSLALGEPSTSADNNVPAELRAYVEDFIALALDIEFNPGDPQPSLTLTSFRPNEPITRREFAQWLVATNNRLHEDQPHKKLRLASNTSEPAFEDIRLTDPDFSVVQGLAEAGIIPSQLLSDGDVESRLFKADAPLTRETLIAWKIPLDVRKALPNATVEKIQATWGFQDAAKIRPTAFSAIAADYENGDRANLRRAFGYTLLLQPQKPVTRAEAAAALWYFGKEDNGISAADLLNRTSTSEDSSNPPANASPSTPAPSTPAPSTPAPSQQSPSQIDT